MTRRFPPLGEHPYDFIFRVGWNSKTKEVLALTDSVANSLLAFSSKDGKRNFIKDSFYDVIKSNGGMFIRTSYGVTSSFVEVGENEVMDKLMQKFRDVVNKKRKKGEEGTAKSERKEVFKKTDGDDTNVQPKQACSTSTVVDLTEDDIDPLVGVENPGQKTPK
ncbi:MAG: hypothetical protein SGILL_005569, partial [Bacillariaceae sp.]